MNSSEVHEHLDKVLASSSFFGAPRVQQFLRFVVKEALEGRAGEIKESVVAVHVFGRSSGFDSHSDSVVRVHATHLRRRLREYYRIEGLDDPMVIELPKGSYVPVFRPASAAPSAPAPLRPRARVRHILAALLALAALGGAAWWLVGALGGATGGASVAVLSFDSAGSEYLADGFAAQLAAVLEKSPGLRVSPPDSTLLFRGEGQDPRAVARALGVRTVLQGSIRVEGERLRVEARLVEGSSGRLLWSQRFESRKADASPILQGIATEVAAALHVPGAHGPQHTLSPEVQELYMWGIFHSGKPDAASRMKGLDYLEHAATVDPACTPALEALAWICATRCYHAEPGKRNWAEKGTAYARQALATDPASFRAHAALGWVLYFYYWDWPGAEREFRQALELNPRYAAGHNLYALALATRQRFGQAVDEARRARQLDPTSFAVSGDLGTIDYCARRFDEVDSLARSVLAAKGAVNVAHFLQAMSETGRGRYSQALRLWEGIAAQDDSEWWGFVGYTRARTGDRDGALDAMRHIPTQADAAGDFATAIATIYTGLGERDKAFEWLDRAADRHESSVLFVPVDPTIDPLRGDPRFEALRKRLGL